MSNVRKKRADGRVVDDVPAYRQVMPYIMRGRNESAVLFEQEVDLSGTFRFVDGFEQRDDLNIKVFDDLMWAAVQTLSSFPRLNRFVAGGRLYQRDDIWLSFSSKKEMVPESPVIVLKRRFDPRESFTEMVRATRTQLAEGRNPEKVDGVPKLTLKYSNDERVENGFYAHEALEHLAPSSRIRVRRGPSNRLGRVATFIRNS